MAWLRANIRAELFLSANGIIIVGNHGIAAFQTYTAHKQIKQLGVSI